MQTAKITNAKRFVTFDSINKADLLKTDLAKLTAASSINLVLLTRTLRRRDKGYYSSFKMLDLKIKWRKSLSKDIKCWVCGKELDLTSVSLDHIVPIAKGGAWNDMKNFAPACLKCNNERSNKSKKAVLKEHEYYAN